MRTLHRFFFIVLALFPLLGSGPITKSAQATVPAAEKKPWSICTMRLTGHIGPTMMVGKIITPQIRVRAHGMV